MGFDPSRGTPSGRNRHNGWRLDCEAYFIGGLRSLAKGARFQWTSKEHPFIADSYTYIYYKSRKWETWKYHVNIIYNL